MNLQSKMTAVNAITTVKNEQPTTDKNDYSGQLPLFKNDCCKILPELFTDALVTGHGGHIAHNDLENIFPQSIMTNNIYIICHSVAAIAASVFVSNLLVLKSPKNHAAGNSAILGRGRPPIKGAING